MSLRYGLVVFYVFVALCVLALFMAARGGQDCKERWQASSIQVVNGKITKPHVTQGCGYPGRRRP